MRRNNPGMMAAGIVMLCVGGVGAIVGIGLISDAEQESRLIQDCFGPACDDFEEDVEEKRVAGIVTALAGLALIGVGIPLTVVGARKVPLEGPPEAQLRLWLSPFGGGLKATY
jgi:hypothetical protein